MTKLLESRKKFKPENNASRWQQPWEFPTEAEYKELQQLGNFDTKRQVG
jgi:hypothetical protein